MNEGINNIDANIAATPMDAEVRARLCSAEIQAVLEKYGMAVAIQRIEKLQPGQGIHVEYNFNFVPVPRAAAND
jgi:hypothetical protein